MRVGKGRPPLLLLQDLVENPLAAPTCYVRFDPAGKTVVWMRCPFCAEEIVVHPQPTRELQPWFELLCGACGRRAGGEREAGKK